MTAIPGTGLSLNLNFKTPANLDCWDDSDESDWIMNGFGACTSVCPLDYATEYPLRTTDGTVPTLANCNGGIMKIHGRRTGNYKLGNEMILKADYWVTDVRTPIVGTTDLTASGLSSLFTDKIGLVFDSFGNCVQMQRELALYCGTSRLLADCIQLMLML